MNDRVALSVMIGCIVAVVGSVVWFEWKIRHPVAPDMFKVCPTGSLCHNGDGKGNLITQGYTRERCVVMNMKGVEFSWPPKPDGSCDPADARMDWDGTVRYSLAWAESH
jgi:hypothetical protein